MKVWVTGATGQLGSKLAQTVPAGIELVTTDSAALDLTDANAVIAFYQQAKPDLIINAAAYTAVDKAEDDKARAYEVNRDAVATLARLTAQDNKRLIHISTDYVFDGTATTPYKPGDATAPLGVYGASKRAGEVAALDANMRTLIFRTAWVYGRAGKNFMLTMLRLMREKERLAVVADQHGTPTSTATLASTIWRAAQSDHRGIYHLTDGGQTTWHGLASAIQSEALTLGLLPRAIPIDAITTADFPTRARRPAYSVLDSSATWRDFGLTQPDWQAQLRATLRELAHG